MNKKAKAINQRRINLVRHLASQVKPFSQDTKWIQQWYMERMAGMTPLQAANHVMDMSDAKLLKLYFLIQKFGGLCDGHKNSNPLWGNMFDIKFPMVVFAFGYIDVFIWEEKYHKWLTLNDPEHKALVKTEQYFYTKCCDTCKKVYYKNPIDRQQGELLAENEHITSSFHNGNERHMQIMSRCSDCCIK